MKSRSLRNALAGSTIALVAAATAGAAGATVFTVTNLVSDGFVPATTIDPSLKDPRGIAFAPTSPFWVANTGTGVATLYSGAGVKQGLTVTIPPPASPTGVVFNGTNDFVVGTSKALFIFATEGGTIDAWNGSLGTTASQVATETGAVFKGLAIGTSTSFGNALFAANFRSGMVDIFNSDYSLVNSFTDPGVAAGYAPFNAQALGGELYVTYAKQDQTGHNDVAGAGIGYVDVFDLNGHLLRRIASPGDEIDSPWGLAIAPSSFQGFAGDLLVGNHGDGTISAFNPLTGAFQGRLAGVGGNPLAFGDLWALTPGNSGVGASTQSIYFTAGGPDDAHGVFGRLTAVAVPEPGAWALMVLGLGCVGAALRRRPRPVAHAI